MRGGVGEQRLLGLERDVLARVVDPRVVDLVDLESQEVDLPGTSALVAAEARRARLRARARLARAARQRSERIECGRRPRNDRARCAAPPETSSDWCVVLPVQVDEVRTDLGQLADGREPPVDVRARSTLGRDDTREHDLVAVGRTNRPSTRASAAPSRTSMASARPPSSSSTASTSSVFPAPVSPVIAVSPSPTRSMASSTIPRSATWSSLQHRYRSARPNLALRIWWKSRRPNVTMRAGFGPAGARDRRRRASSVPSSRPSTVTTTAGRR